AVHFGGHVRELERDTLVLDDRDAELLALTRVLDRVLERRARDPHRLAADERTRDLERPQRPGPALVRRRRPRALELRLQAVVPADDVRRRDEAVLQDHLGSVGCADPELALLSSLPDALRLLARN